MSETIPSSIVSPESSSDVLSQVQVFNLLMQLEKLLRTLPSSLPLPTNNKSCYQKLLSFNPLPSDWHDDIGVVGTVNRQLEIVFGTRAFGFKLKERGAMLESVVPILRDYLFAHPGDIILQKWLHNLVQAAMNAHNQANQSAVPDDQVMDLTGKMSDDDGLPGGAALLAQACRSKRCGLNSPVPEDSSSEEQDTVETKPGNKKRCKAHVKRKGPLPPQDDIKVTPAKIDPRMVHLPKLDHDPSKGGAPPNLLVQELTTRCYPLGMLPDKFQFRCIASFQCRRYIVSRHADRVFKHGSRCDNLKRMRPELHSRATQAMADYFSNSTPASSTKSTTPSQSSSQPDTDTQSTSLGVFAAFRDQGKRDFGSEATLAALRLICATGIPPRILDSPEWRSYNDVLLAKIPGHRYRPPSASTMSDKLIPARAAQVTLDVRRILSKQHNLTVSFNGLTKGNQLFYTVHIITPDCHVFFYAADVFRGSHNSKYVQSLLNRVADEIGVSRIAAVVSDDANTVKKARRDFAKDYPLVLNLADPIHKLHLIARDMCLDPIWSEMHKTNQTILNFSGHSTHASTRLSEARKDCSIQTGLVSMSKSWFGHKYLTTDSVRINLPAMYLAHRKGLASSVPAELNRVFGESSMQATQFRIMLLQFTLVLEPVYQALTCLESSNCTLADVFAYWIALIAALDHYFSSPECTLPPEVILCFRTIINAQFLEALVKVPTDVYLTAFYLHPDFCNANVFQYMNAMLSKLYIWIPAPNPISPAPHIPDLVIAEKLFSVLPNSMCDKRTGSQFTFLDSDLRSPARFRDLPNASRLLLLEQQEAAADEGRSTGHPAGWFEGKPWGPDPELHAECSVEELAGQLSALQIINLQSPHLTDMLSNLAVASPASDNGERWENGSTTKGKEKERARTVNEVKWD